ncbi:polysaccharide deacetylase family protein [Lusitaniella coriacea]|uniref:polysaccharide deacetylase family protein n=1 Tax=Lusitaniella coriacea TaxID=1983105 RepID=UPI001D1493F3|nr:polysaccharide deacetylase family protein [Lusitaniella coriacea]
MAQHHSLIWQRRTLFAIAIAAASFTFGLLIPALKGNSPKTANGIQIKLDLNNQDPDPIQAKSLALSDAKVFQNLVANLERLEQEQKRIYDFSLPQAFQGKTIKSVQVPAERKVIALTFDDGPWPGTTNDILYILKKNNIKATFFFLGRNVQNFPELAKIVVNHGHVLANHTWSHPYRQHSEAAAASEINRTTEIIYKLTGAKSVLFRPPGGYLTNGLATYAAKQNQSVVMWSADSQDYRTSSANMVRNVLRDASPGGIVLMHDGGGDRRKTVNALPVIIDKLKAQGYEFVTVPELMEMQKQPVANR